MNSYIISSLFTNKSYQSYLVQLLTKFTNNFPPQKIKQIYSLIKAQEPDNKIISLISSDAPPISAMSSKKRAERISHIWRDLLMPLLPLPLPPKINTYLDIGSNNGTITVEFGSSLNLPPSAIHGIDVNNFTQQKIVPIDGFVFTPYDGYNIPFDSNYFDLITCSMVLHHVEYPYVLIGEIRRVLKPTGFLLIKEHDAYSPEIKDLVYIEHALFDILDHRISLEEFSQRYYQRLFSKKEFLDIMKEFGFELIMYGSEAFMKKHHRWNPNQSYYAIFKKKKIE